MQERRPIVLPQSHVPTLYPALFYDDASGTMNYTLSGDGSDYSVGYNTAAAYVGTNGLRMSTRVTSPASGDEVLAYKHIPQPPTQLARIRLLTKQPTANPHALISFLFYWWDGTNFYAPEILLDTRDEKVYYATGVRSGYTDSGVTFTELNGFWNYLDLCVNLNTHKYGTLRVNNSLADLSSIDIPSSAGAYSGVIRFYLALQSVSADTCYADFDQIIITAENP